VPTAQLSISILCRFTSVVPGTLRLERSIMSECAGILPRAFLGLMVLAGPLLAGCGSSGPPQPRVIKVEKLPPLQVVRIQLEQYAAGQAVDSERELFPGWVSDVRASDPQAADLIEQGLRRIESNPSQARAIAQKMLEQLP
jgi:hypothetical protein